MIPKSWLESVVLWVNVAIVIISGLVQVVQGMSDFMSPEANVVLSQITVYLVLALNFLMRFKTTNPIVMATPATALAMRLPDPQESRSEMV